ncbi:MAG: rhodanese-like domain-containing protein [Treponema sp.]|nr:rhodanese-like domain-containing protein [Treponema sp.]
MTKSKFLKMFLAAAVVATAAIAMVGCPYSPDNDSPDNDTRLPFDITLSVTGTHDFGRLTLGYNADNITLTVTVTNTGYLPTGELTVALPSSAFDRSPAVVPCIPAGGSGTFTVSPSPGWGLTLEPNRSTVQVWGDDVSPLGFDVTFEVLPITIGHSLAHTIMSELGSGAVILDVRWQEEFDVRHLEGAVLLPYTEILERAAAELPDRNRVILVYCRRGRRSEDAAIDLLGMGYTSVFDFGGIAEPDYWPYGGLVPPWPPTEDKGHCGCDVECCRVYENCHYYGCSCHTSPGYECICPDYG